MLACGEGRRRRGWPRRRWMDEIHEVTGMKLAELREVTSVRKQWRRLAMMVSRDPGTDSTTWHGVTLLNDVWLNVSPLFCCILPYFTTNHMLTLICWSIECECTCSKPTFKPYLNHDTGEGKKRRIWTMRVGKEEMEHRNGRGKGGQPWSEHRSHFKADLSWSIKSSY